MLTLYITLGFLCLLLLLGSVSSLSPSSDFPSTSEVSSTLSSTITSSLALSKLGSLGSLSAESISVALAKLPYALASLYFHASHGGSPSNFFNWSTFIILHFDLGGS